MLNVLRSKKTAKKIWIFLAIVIIPAFCLWGFGSALRSKRKPVFIGKVSGKTVSIQEYIRNYKAVRNQYLIQLGEEQLAKLEKYLDLEAQVWDRIVLLAEAKRQKIKASNKEVVDSIKQYPFFQKGNTFDAELYKEIVTYVFRDSPREFEEEIRDRLIIAKLYQQITDQITVNDDEVKAAYIKDNEQISIEYVSVQLQDFLNEVSVEEQELLDYYNNNSEDFSKPLSYNLEYIKLEHKDEQIIDKVTQSLNQGFSLQDVAKEASLEVKETGLFSINEPIPQIGWSTEILKIIPKLKPQGQAWPQPIKLDTNVVNFIRLKEKKEPYIQSFDDVKNEVNTRLRQQKAKQIAREKIEACRNEAEISGLTSAAKKLNLKSDETELFKRKGYVEGLGDSDIFFGAVQNLNEDGVSQIISIPSGFCVVKLKERTTPDEEEFEHNKQNFTKKLLEEKKQTYFGQFLAELKKRPNTSLLKSID